jgi:hypothetical protein
MKKIITICAALILAASVFAQAPQKMSYQAVIRNNQNALISNQAIGMRVSILQGSTIGTTVYVETHTPTTNVNGLASIEIGGGTIVNGTFAGISWSNGPFFVKTETDPTGGSNYSISGTSQLLSVPYALFAGSTSNGIPQGGTNGQILTLCNNAPTWTTNGVCPPTYPFGSVFCASGPTVVLDVTNPSTGKTWMDRNLGATQVAISSSDVNAYGDLYQWGRGNDGHQCRNSANTNTLSSSSQPGHGDFIIAPNGQNDWINPQNTNLWQGVNGVNNPCPSGYRLPTEVELDAERMSWSSNDFIGAFSSPLKLTLAGNRNYSNGLIGYLANGGFYWTNTCNGTLSKNLEIYSNSSTLYQTTRRSYGLSIRCIKN